MAPASQQKRAVAAFLLAYQLAVDSFHLAPAIRQARSSPLVNKCKNRSPAAATGCLRMYNNDGQHKTSQGTQASKQASNAVIESPPTQPAYTCEVSYDNLSLSRLGRSRMRCWDSALTPERAQQVVLEAMEKLSVPRTKVMDALNCMLHAAEETTATGTGQYQLQSFQGFWRLSFCSASPFAEPQFGINKDGYVTKGLGINLRLNTATQEMLMHISGGLLSASKTLKGVFNYLPGKQMFESRFSEARVGPLILRNKLAAWLYGLCRDPVEWRVVYLGERAMVLLSEFQGKQTFMVFTKDQRQTEAAQANALRQAGRVMEMQRADVSPAEQRRQKALEAWTAIHGEAPRAHRSEVAPSPVDEPQMTEAEKADFRQVGGTASFLRYIEEETLMLYLIMAGPCILSFLKFYQPVAQWKGQAAIIVLTEALQQLLGRHA